MDDEDSPEARAKRRLARLMIKPPPIAIQVKLIEELVETLADRLEAIKLRAREFGSSNEADGARQDYLSRVHEGLETILKLLDTAVEQ